MIQQDIAQLMGPRIESGDIEVPVWLVSHIFICVLLDVNKPAFTGTGLNTI